MGRRRLVPVLCVLAATLVAPAAALAEEAAPPPHELPPASYPSTFSEQRFIRMDDGVELGATITFPSENGSEPAPGRFPVVLNITPYGRDAGCGCENATNYATRGFVLAVVDVRGTGGSQGNLDENYFSRREAKDGYDLVEFLGAQPWSSGKVGMSGGSYLGIMEYLTAEEDPAHLAAIVPDEALSDIYNDAADPGGILSLFFDDQYLGLQGTLGLSGVNTEPSMIPGTLEAKFEQATGRSIAFAYLEKPYEDSFYYERSPITRVAKIKVPVFVLDGWRDAFVAGDIRMFEHLERRTGVETLLNVGPCTHKGCGPPFDPESEPPGIDNIEAQELQFFQRNLMGMEVPSLPRVRVYDQQAGAYVETTAWPSPTTKFKREYLSGEALAPKAPAQASASYVTDPAAGLSMTFDQEGTVAITPYIPLDQRVEEEQGLTWRTPALSQPLTLNGPIAMHLVASSSATNTDWFAKVSDVAPNGEQSIVAEGQLRASLRALARGSTTKQPLQTLTTPEALEPGKFYDYEIAIAPTAYEFAAGHRLQLRVTSYNMPNALPGTIKFDESEPAATTFEPLPPATNIVRFGGLDGSSLLLPVAAGGVGAAMATMEEHVISRRALLGRAALATGGLVSARLIAGPGRVLASTLPLPGGANETVASLVPSAEECAGRVQRMVDFGPRLTGSPAHNHYIAWLEAQFTKYGCTMLPRDYYPLDYWHLKGTTPCSLKISNGSSPQTVPINSYYPRSGATGPKGVTGPLVYLGAGPPPSIEPSNPLTLPEAVALYESTLNSWVSAAIGGAGRSLEGSIVMIDLPLPLPITSAAFMPLLTYYYPTEDFATAGTDSYKRLWIAGGAGLEQLKEAGAIGVVFGFDASPAAMDGQYVPFSSSGPGLPALNVDRDTATKIRTLAAATPVTTLTLHAESEPSTSPSIVAVLPGDGSTDEVMVVNTHTDGQNFVEENGGVAETFLARYFHRLPPGKKLKRTLVFSAVTGHMAPNMPQTQGFIEAHPDIIEKTVAAITIEHFGTSEWLDPLSGYYEASKYEPGGCWCSTSEMVVPLIECIEEHEIDKTAILRGPVALGIGGPFFTKGLPSIGYLTGPNYLVQIAANGCVDKLNADLYAHQVAWYADLLTRYDKMSAEELRKGDPEIFGA